jgi:hypothetical protein
MVAETPAYVSASGVTDPAISRSYPQIGGGPQISSIGFYHYKIVFSLSELSHSLVEF